jgi:hypothetical protein
MIKAVLPFHKNMSVRIFQPGKILLPVHDLPNARAKPSADTRLGFRSTSSREIQFVDNGADGMSGGRSPVPPKIVRPHHSVPFAVWPVSRLPLCKLDQMPLLGNAYFEMIYRRATRSRANRSFK